MAIGQEIADANGFFLDVWVWNWLLWFMSAGKLIGCSNIGLIGLLFLNDDGEMTARCFQTGVVGANPEFIGVDE